MASKELAVRTPGTVVSQRPKRLENITMEEVQLIWTNFAGREEKYNKKGDRNFTVILDPELGQHMLDLGWNVKVKEPRDEYEEPMFSIKVSVGFEFFPPKIVVLTKRSKTVMTEEFLWTIDDADIRMVDLTIRAHHWNVNGNVGVKAWCKTMYIILNEDYLDEKYENWLGETPPHEIDPPSFEEIAEYDDPNIIDVTWDEEEN